MKKRLIEFLSYLGIGQLKFEENVGLSRGFVNKVGDSIRTNNLNKIVDKYPELNINWLMTGEGSMLKQTIKGGVVLHTIGSGNVTNTGSIRGNIHTSHSNDERIKELELLVIKQEAEIQSLKNTIEMLIQSIKK